MSDFRFQVLFNFSFLILGLYWCAVFFIRFFAYFSMTLSLFFKVLSVLSLLGNPNLKLKRSVLVFEP